MQIRGGADKSLAQSCSRCSRTESRASLERGACSCDELQLFLVTESRRKHVRRRARFQQHRDASSHEDFFPCKARPIRKFTLLLSETWRETAPSYATVKNWVAQLNCFTCVAPRPGRSKIVTTPEIIDQIQELILEDRRISAKSIAEILGILRELVGSIINEGLDMRKLSAKWVQTCLNTD